VARRKVRALCFVGRSRVRDWEVARFPRAPSPELLHRHVLLLLMVSRLRDLFWQLPHPRERAELTEFLRYQPHRLSA